MKKNLESNAPSYIKQILEVTFHETAAVRPSTSYLTNHPNKTNKACRTLLKKQGLTHKWPSSVDPCTWTCQCWPTKKNLPTTALCWDTGCTLENLPEGMNHRDEWREGIREIHASSATWLYIYIYIGCYKNTSNISNCYQCGESGVR